MTDRRHYFTPPRPMPAAPAPPPEDEKPIDEFDWHEAMDRASLFAQVVDIQLLQLRAVQSDSEIMSKIEAATEALCAAYQLLGERRFDYRPHPDREELR